MADPVSIIVGPIVNNIIDTVASLIREEILAILEVKNEVDNLSSNLTAIAAVLKDAEQRQLDATSSSLKDWLGKLKDAAWDAEDILDTFKTETLLWKRKRQNRRTCISLSKVSFKSNVAHKIKDISARLDAIAKERNNFHLTTSGDGGMPTPVSVDVPGDVFGRESDRDALINQMLSNESDVKDDVSVIPIVGMGGVGKTTLAQLIFNHERVKNHFEYRMWVHVSVVFDVGRILKEIIKSQPKITYSNDENTLGSRFLEFWGGKKFLLVLDDVWNHNYNRWEPLRNMLRQGDKGSRVLVTTRSTKVSQIIGTQPPYRLEDLPHDPCWSLFKKIAFKDNRLSDVTHTEELESIGRKIVKKCRGLPLAVKAMGAVLRGNDDVNKWNQILRNSIWENDQNLSEPKILPALKLSYDHLPSNLKQCYAYCSIFPKDYVFDRKELVKLWMAEAFIQPSPEKCWEETGIDYFNELLMRFFFETLNINDKERYRMHDVIHELALSVSTPHCCQVQDENSRSLPINTRHVSLLARDAENPAWEIIETSKKLRTLLLPGKPLKGLGQALDKMFHSLEYIRVLNLSSSLLSELPSSIENLKLLRYLDLSRTDIRKLPDAICNLYNLQTLKLLGCPGLSELPKDLGNLVNLRHLELDVMFWVKCRILPPRMGCLTSLQNLHAFPVGGTSGQGIEELKNMANLTKTLHISKLENAVNAGEAKLNEKKSLQKLVLEWTDKNYDQQDEVRAAGALKDLQPHPNLEELALHHFKGYSFPSWMTDGPLQKLVRLTLSHCSKCTTVLSIAQFPCLKELYIKGMRELEEWPEDECPSLTSLHINTCPKLRKVPDSMPRLIVLKIKKCDSLKALPNAPRLQALILIDNLVLEDWQPQSTLPQQGLILIDNLVLEDWQPRSSLPQQGLILIDNLVLEGWQPQSTLPQQGLILIADLVPEGGPPQSTLRLVRIGNSVVESEQTQSVLRHLRSLKMVNCPSIQALPDTFSLQRLEISGCGLINALPGPQSALYLQYLTLDSCSHGTLVRRIPGTNSLYSLVISNISNLTSFPTLSHLPRLKALYIGDCKGLTCLSEEEGSLKSLSSLKLLSIRGCSMLESLPNEGLPTGLECLMIASCPILNSLGTGETLKSLLSLKDLYLEDCPLIRSFPEDGLPTSLLHLKIHECPLLVQQCQEGDEGSTEWPKIMHVPDQEIDCIRLPEKKKWTALFGCCKCLIQGMLFMMVNN